MADSKTLDQLCINTIRTLSMDAVQAANSGHPGTPMALAPVAYCSVAATSCGSIRRTRSGRTATASCCRPGTRRCCSTRLLHLTGVKAVNPSTRCWASRR